MANCIATSKRADAVLLARLSMKNGFFYVPGKRAAAAGGLSHMGRGADPLQTSAQVFEHVLAPGNPGREWGRMLVLHIQDAGQLALCAREGKC